MCHNDFPANRRSLFRGLYWFEDIFCCLQVTSKKRDVAPVTDFSHFYYEQDKSCKPDIAAKSGVLDRAFVAITISTLELVFAVIVL